MLQIIHIPGKIQKAADYSSITPVEDPTNYKEEDRFCSAIWHFVSCIRVAATQDKYQEVLQRDLFNLDPAPAASAPSPLAPD